MSQFLYILHTYSYRSSIARLFKTKVTVSSKAWAKHRALFKKHLSHCTKQVGDFVSYITSSCRQTYLDTSPNLNNVLHNCVHCIVVCIHIGAYVMLSINRPTSGAWNKLILSGQVNLGLNHAFQTWNTDVIHINLF